MEKVISIPKGKHIKIEVLSINKPTQEEAQVKIKELSEYLSLAWSSPDNSE
jgi:hypothetical protein